MRRLFALALAVTLSWVGAGAQTVVQHVEEREGKIQLTETIAIPAEDAGYTLVLPDGGTRGLVVFFHASRDTTGNQFNRMAVSRGLAAMYVTTGNRVDFLFGDDSLAQLDGYITGAIRDHEIPAHNVMVAGMSLAGTRALRYAIYCARGRSRLDFVPRAAAVCDAPLDFVRFWHSAVKNKTLAFHPAAANEGQWTTASLERGLGGTPDEARMAYVDYSPYCHGARSGGNATWLRDVAVRAYTEPDVQWWMENRRQDYYDMNAIDAAGLVNQLHILGNESAELITTTDRGYRPDGTRHPHSWSIVDERELLDWFVSTID